jgi:hypothetical protein
MEKIVSNINTLGAIRQITHLGKNVVSVWWLPTRRRSWRSLKLGGQLFFKN